MLIQAVVDHNYLFRDLCIGWPGSVHDARVLANSALYKKVTGGELLQGEEIQLQGQTLGTFVIGDSAYPFLPWLVKPFLFSSSLNSQQKKFNYKLSQARVVVEIAFGCLKARWHRLSKQIDIHIDNVPHIIAACCVLHNVCETHHDGLNEEWLQEFETELDQPENGTLAEASMSHGSEGNQIRTLLMDYFNQQ